jgi:hypothetical protein
LNGQTVPNQVETIYIHDFYPAPQLCRTSYRSDVEYFAALSVYRNMVRGCDFTIFAIFGVIGWK